MHYLIGILTQGETKQEAHGNALAFADELGVVLDERTGECLEVQRVRHAEGAIKPETERMRGELGVEARGEARNIGGWGVGRWDRNRTCNLRFRILFA